MDDSAIAQPTPSVTPEQTFNKSSGQMIIIAIVVVIVIAVVGVIAYKASKKSAETAVAPTPTATPVAQSAQPLPTPTPVTTQNASQVLDQTGAAIEADMNQLNADISTLNQNNANQDNPNNL